ncbi:MAG: PIN domain-containing protein [Chloroflexota bacterium]
MKLGVALSRVRRLYVEAASLIYYVEEHPVYLQRMEIIVAFIEDTPIEALSSVISLTEVLNQPIKKGRNDLEQAYRDILISSARFRLLLVSQTIAESAARLRASYNLRTPDALHIATALDAACDAFLTNDNGLKRVTEIRILALDDLELDGLP